MSRAFVAEEVAGEVRDRLWLYVSQHSAPSEVAAVAESLFSLRRGELRRLTAAHLADSDRAAAMLAAAPGLLRDLPSSASRSELELRAAVRPPVNWPKTHQRRLASGDRQRFVCRPPERAYDTALARLLLLALDRCAELPQLAQLGSRGELGDKVAARAGRASHLRGHAKLRQVRPVRRLPQRTLASLRRHRGAEAVIEWVRFASLALDDQDPGAVREVIEERLLPPKAAETLFELYVGFRLVDALVAAGFVEVDHRLIANGRVPFATLRRGGQTATVHWQRSLWSLADGAVSGRYREVLDGAEMRASSLQPDFAISLANPDRLAFVEVKLTTRDGVTRDREGIRDALAYAFDAEPLLAPHPQPHGLVVAWNADGQPGPGRILVADQEAIGDAVATMLDGWRLAP